MVTTYLNRRLTHLLKRKKLKEKTMMSDLKDFQIEDGVLIKYTGEEAIVNVPAGVLELAQFCFEDTNVEEIILPYTVEKICGVAFNETPTLKRIVVDSANSNFCSIDGCLYSKDKKRFILSANRTDTLVIAEGCEVIAPYAFFQRRVAGIVFPKTLKCFEHSALCNCYVDADELIIPNIEFVGGEWFQATTLPPMVKVEGVKELADGAFAFSSFGCMRLPSTLTEIGGWAFYNCNMSRVYVPKSVTKLGENVFAIDCPIDTVDVEEGYSEEYSWYGNEEQEDNSNQAESPLVSCPVGFLLGVDNEECAAAKYAKENNIPYEIVLDVESFLNAECKDKK